MSEEHPDRTNPTQLNVEYVALDDIGSDPANARRHPERNLTDIAASLRRFGQQKPIVIDFNGTVRAGNGTLEAARSLGWSHINIVRSELPLTELAAYSIADNRTGETSEWDEEVLRGYLSEPDIDPATLGFQETELTALFNRETKPGENPTPANDPTAEWKNMPEFAHEDKNAFRSVIVHFKDQAAVDQFTEATGLRVMETTRFIWYPIIEIERAYDKRYSAMEPAVSEEIE